MSNFVPTISFNKGDQVFDKQHNTQTIVLNNYGNQMVGDRGEIRTEADGNVDIFEYDQNFNRVGYNLIKVN